MNRAVEIAQFRQRRSASTLKTHIVPDQAVPAGFQLTNNDVAENGWYRSPRFLLTPGGQDYVGVNSYDDESAEHGDSH